MYGRLRVIGFIDLFACDFKLGVVIQGRKEVTIDEQG